MAVIIKIDCMWNDRGAWCKNNLIKRSLWGFGARCCIFPPYGDGCSIRMPHPRPIAPPPAPKPKEDNHAQRNYNKAKQK